MQRPYEAQVGQSYDKSEQELSGSAMVNYWLVQSIASQYGWVDGQSSQNGLPE